jgi:hypothetical protein
MAELSVRSLCFLLACSSAAAPINLVLNPSFEDDLVSPSESQANTYINGYAWQVFSSISQWGLGIDSYGVELQRNNLYGVPSNAPGGGNAWDGIQWAELDYQMSTLAFGDPAMPQIFQDISTTPGATYLLSFYYTPRPDGGTQQLGIFWGNTSDVLPALVQSTSVGVGANMLTRTRYDFELVATSTSMRLGFGSLQNLVVTANGVITFAGGNLLDMVTLALAEGTTGPGGPGDTGTTGTTGTNGTTGTTGTTGTPREPPAQPAQRAPREPQGQPEPRVRPGLPERQAPPEPQARPETLTRLRKRLSRALMPCWPPV